MFYAVLNDDIRIHNPQDTVGGMQGIPINSELMPDSAYAGLLQDALCHLKPGPAQ